MDYWGNLFQTLRMGLNQVLVPLEIKLTERSDIHKYSIVNIQ
jgi:hypothetical protein